jgi:transposase
MEEVGKAKKRLGLPEDCPVRSCYEAGRDGFWIHRFLGHIGISNLVVDAGSIEVSRRKRRAKTDRLDARKLLEKLLEYHSGKKPWSVVRVPSEETEDARRLERELAVMKKERTMHRNRIRSLLILEGIDQLPGKDYSRDLDRMRRWDGTPLGVGLRKQVERECARLAQVKDQVRQLEGHRREMLKSPQTQGQKKAARLVQLRGVGPVSANLLSSEMFGWRDLKNRRQVGAAAGLTGTPYNSGDIEQDQGISKSGNRRVRATMIELAWGWLQWQPQSALSQWFEKRFAAGGKRMRRVGIVAVARKLLVALWKYLEWGEIPEGAVFSKA